MAQDTDQGAVGEVVDRGGDPACWAHLVCPACGRILEGKQTAVCGACGASLGDD